MKKIKGCLWSTTVLFLSAIVPLYGGDDDDDLDSAPKAKCKEVAQPAGGQNSALPKTFKEIQSEFKGNFVNIQVPATNVEKVFEEIKQSFREQSQNDFCELCLGLWDGVPFYGNLKAGIIRKTLISCLPPGCILSYLEAKAGSLKIGFSAREARFVHFVFYCKDCEFICKVWIYKDDFGVRLRRMELGNKEAKLGWRLDEPEV